MSTIARTGPAAASRAKPVVIALHCSGASGCQWRPLADALGDGFEVIAPDSFGCPARGHWPGERRFALKEEASLVRDLIDAAQGPVHLVGHSYGGGVALRAAVRCRRPHHQHIARGQHGRMAIVGQRDLQHVARKMARQRRDQRVLAFAGGDDDDPCMPFAATGRDTALAVGRRG